MPKQIGAFVISGTMYNATFVRTEDGFLVRQKSRLDGETVKNDPRFARTRENNREFANAAAAAKVIVGAFKNAVPAARDSKTYSRLLTACFAALKADAVNPRGERRVVDGDLQQLKLFNFNRKAPFDTVVKKEKVTGIDRETGEVTLELPAYVPTHDIEAPEGSTHYRIVLVGAELDIPNRIFKVAEARTGYLPYTDVAATPLELTASLPANSDLPMMLAVGVEFFQQKNGNHYPLKSGNYNALTIALVDA